MEAIEITDKIIFIRGQNRGRYPYSNSLLIAGDEKALIDTGTGPEVAAEIAEKYRIDLVINSHGHEDHTAGNDLFKDARVCAHRLDAPLIRDVSKLRELYASDNGDADSFIEMLFKEQFKLKDSMVDFEFEDGHTFDLGAIKVEAVHTPGHSAGHCCFHVPSEGFLFLADIDLSSFGPWYGCLDCDLDRFIESIKKVRDIGCETAATSHKGVIRGRGAIEEKLTRFLDRIFEREARYIDCLDECLGRDEIVEKAIIYGRFIEPVAVFKLFERTMLEKHQERLDRKKFIAHSHKGFKAVIRTKERE